MDLILRAALDVVVVVVVLACTMGGITMALAMTRKRRGSIKLHRVALQLIWAWQRAMHENRPSAEVEAIEDAYRIVVMLIGELEPGSRKALL